MNRYKEDPSYPELISDCYREIDKWKSLAGELFRVLELTPSDMKIRKDVLAKAREAGL